MNRKLPIPPLPGIAILGLVITVVMPSRRALCDSAQPAEIQCYSMLVAGCPGVSGAESTSCTRIGPRKRRLLTPWRMFSLADGDRLELAASPFPGSCGPAGHQGVLTIDPRGGRGSKPARPKPPNRKGSPRKICKWGRSNKTRWRSSSRTTCIVGTSPRVSAGWPLRSWRLCATGATERARRSRHQLTR